MRILSLLPLLASVAWSQVYNWSRVEMGGGGMVTGLVAAPSESGVFYARTDVGGAYRWNESAGKWTQLLEHVSEADKGLLGVEAIAVDPASAANVYLLVGTSYFSGGKTAILRSSNYGATFSTTEVTSLFTAHGNGDGRQAGEKLVVDPHNSSILFCGSRSNKLFKSTDKGANWSLAYSNFGSANASGVNFVVFDSTSASGGKTQRLFVGVGANGAIYQSNDGGSTFSALASVPSFIPQRAVVLGDNLYVTFSNAIGPWSVGGGAFWRYTISTKTWTNLTPSGYTSGYGFGGISVDPKNAQRLVLSTTGMWSKNQTYASGANGWGDYIFLSTNGGTSWTVVNSSLDVNGFKWLNGNAIHVAGAVVFNPYNTAQAWVTSGNGVYRTDNIGTAAWKFYSKGIEETVAFEVLSLPSGKLVTSLGDYDGATYTDPTVSTAVHNPSMGTTIGLAYAGTAKTLVRAGSAIYYSTNEGSTWTKFSTMNGVKGQLAITADGASVIHRSMDSYEAFTGNVYRTTNNGSNWTTVSLSNLSTDSRIVCDPVNASYCYVVNSSGNLMRSSDKGATFSQVASTGSSSFGYLRTVPGREGHLWLPLRGNGLAYSTDKGATWTKATGIYAAAVGFGKAATGASYETIFVWGYTGSNSNPGVYRSTDKGATWVRVNDDLHQFGGTGNGNFVAGDMNVFGRVYMSTVGLGIVMGTETSGASSSSSVVSSSSSLASSSSGVSSSSALPSSSSGTSSSSLSSSSVSSSSTVSSSSVRSSSSTRSSSSQTTALLPGNSPWLGGGVQYRAYALNGKPLWNGFRNDLSALPAGRWIVVERDATGNLRYNVKVQD